MRSAAPLSRVSPKNICKNIVRGETGPDPAWDYLAGGAFKGDRYRASLPSMTATSAPSRKLTSDLAR
ncbi:hypothetical protein K227x_48160 [Rubripirellula lacrimiformis]|uniref:Uncharacterized protein n=1 Tax=Rubripirellula lacrimiformis TaxID=1930273 RepID=A0A517NGZ5_9BACT|nr:hypothetical protein K227x_48160 [Rubripirellula lacrimiformis]